jgi:nucleolar protein 56
MKPFNGLNSASHFLFSIEFYLFVGVRTHFANMVKGFTSKSSGVAQLGLGHSYSRAKVKFNVNRVDNMIIQSIALLDQLDKDINTFAMRIR